MTIQETEYLLAVLSEGSINKAAGKLFISQSALSKIIRKIEQEYDITLFIRTPGEHAMKLTGEGEIFIEHIRRIHQEHEILLQRLKGKKDKRHSVISIGMTARISNILSPKLIRWLQSNHPEIYIRVIEDNSEELEKAVENGGLNIAYVSRHTLDSGILSYDVVGEIKNYIYLKTGSTVSEHAFRCEGMPYPCLHLSDLCDEVISVSGPDHRASRIISRLEKKSGITFRKRIENNPMNRIQLADIGQCSTIISDFGLQHRSFDTARLYCLAEEDSIPIRQVLCSLPEFRRTEQAEIIVEAFRAVTAELFLSE